MIFEAIFTSFERHVQRGSSGRGREKRGWTLLCVGSLPRLLITSWAHVGNQKLKTGLLHDGGDLSFESLLLPPGSAGAGSQDQELASGIEPRHSWNVHVNC